MTKDEARAMLRDYGLRTTAPRVAVLRLLAQEHRPLSYSEVLEKLGDTDWDPATIYRNLVKLRDAGVAPVVNRAEGLDRYALIGTDRDDHSHPHFVCDDCGVIACLPADLAVSVAHSVDSPWVSSIQRAMVNLRGECPDCLDSTHKSQGS